MPLGARIGLNHTRLRSSAAPSAFAAYALALDFDSQAYWVGGAQAANLAAVPGYTFTRTGIQGAVDAAGAVAFFAANTPAINTNGYHAYGALTNFLINSQDFSAASWTGTGFTVSANAALAPDGTLTADTLNAGVANSGHYIGENITVSATGVHTYSVLVKVGTAQYVQLICDLDGAFGSGVNFDLQTKTVTQQAAGTTGYIVDLGTGYLRLVMVFTAAAVGPSNVYIAIINSGTAGRVASFIGASETLYVWQAQTLAGTFPDGGPLIATAGATAAIGEGQLNVNDAPASADQLFFATANFTGLGAGNQRLAVWSDATLNERVDIVVQGNLPSALVVDGGVNQLNHIGGAIAAGTITLFVLRSGGNWRAGKVVAGALTWFGAAVAGTFPTMTQVNTGNISGGGGALEDRLLGAFRKVGTFATDQSIIDAVAETA